MKKLAVGIISFQLFSCQLRGGSGSEDDNGNKNESYSYSYEENGCKTGEQKFSNKDDYCRGLLDESRNNGCAYSLRSKTYQNACGKLPDDHDSSGPTNSTDSLDPAVKKVLDKRLTNSPMSTSGGYLAVALTVKSDGSYTAQIARGANSNITPESGTTISSGWSASGSTIALSGLGNATAGSINSAPGVVLTIKKDSLGINSTVMLYAH